MNLLPHPPPGSVTNCELRTIVPSLLTVHENNKDKPYSIIECQGKGRGLFTRKNFKENQQIIIKERCITIEEDERVNEAALRYRLPPKQISILSELENHDTGNLITMLNTNAFQLPSNGEDEIMRWGVFPMISRINHSCSPNCVVLINSNGTADIKTIIPIQANTELTISYNRIDHGLSPCYRIRSLVETKKFTCNCELCFKKRQTDSPIQKQIVDYCLDNLSEQDCDKTVEELIGTVHAAAKLLKGGYKHWAIAYSLRTLMLNTTAAVAHYEFKNSEWNQNLLLLVMYFTKWTTYHLEHNDDYGILPEPLPQWLVDLLFSGCSSLFKVNDSDVEIATSLQAALTLIKKPHFLYYGESHEDSLFINSALSMCMSVIPPERNQRQYFNSEANMLAYTFLNPEAVLLQDYIENEEPLENKIIAPVSVFCFDFLKLGLDENSFTAVNGHAKRILSDFKKYK